MSIEPERALPLHAGLNSKLEELFRLSPVPGFNTHTDHFAAKMRRVNSEAQNRNMVLTPENWNRVNERIFRKIEAKIKEFQKKEKILFFAKQGEMARDILNSLEKFGVDALDGLGPNRPHHIVPQQTGQAGGVNVNNAPAEEYEERDAKPWDYEKPKKNR